MFSYGMISLPMPPMPHDRLKISVIVGDYRIFFLIYESVSQSETTPGLKPRPQKFVITFPIRQSITIEELSSLQNWKYLKSIKNKYILLIKIVIKWNIHSNTLLNSNITANDSSFHKQNLWKSNTMNYSEFTAANYCWKGC